MDVPLIIPFIYLFVYLFIYLYASPLTNFTNFSFFRIVKLYTEKLNRRAEEIPLTTQTTHQQAPDNRQAPIKGLVAPFVL